MWTNNRIQGVQICTNKHKCLNEKEKQIYHSLWKNDIFTRGIYNGQFIAVLSKHDLSILNI